MGEMRDAVEAYLALHGTLNPYEQFSATLARTVADAIDKMPAIERDWNPTADMTVREVRKRLDRAHDDFTATGEMIEALDDPSWTDNPPSDLDTQ